MEELYDLKLDPHQMNNVASNRDYVEIKRKLNSQLLGTLKRTKDPRMVDGGQYFENVLTK